MTMTMTVTSFLGNRSQNARSVDRSVGAPVGNRAPSVKSLLAKGYPARYHPEISYHSNEISPVSLEATSMKSNSPSRWHRILSVLGVSAIMSFAALAQAEVGAVSSGPSLPDAAVAARVVHGRPGGLDQPPIVTLGHGAFIGPDGKEITPDREFIDRAQSYYINSLLRQVVTGPQQGKLAVNEAQKLIYAMVGDGILANALFIDWLVENSKPTNAANLISVNGALRLYYLEKLEQARSKDSKSKGIDRDAAERLEKAGIKVFLRTSAGGEKYIQECRDAGVPIPPPVFSAAWINRGAIPNPFLSSSARAELMHYTSSSPPGVCLALPRYESTGGGTFSNEAFLFGLICLGTQSNKACFWDNPRGKRFTKGVEVDINQFVGGEDLVANNQGICSDCHAGENPYVVHPDKAPFAGLTPSILPSGWYDPLVDPSWPQNPGPTNLLDAVSSPGRCDTCHRVGVAGRFPEASTQLPGWCGVVFANAVGPVPTGTMPPMGFTKSQFTAHINALKAACGAPPSAGVVVEVNYPDDPSYVSAPVVIDPLYACATKVAVRGGMLDAKLSVFINGGLVDSRVARNPDFEEFNVPDLKVGDIVTAKQEFAGVLSGSSAPVTVRDHTADFPAGLPAPDVDPGLIYECAEIVAVRHVPGAKLTVLTNGAFPSSGSTSTGWTAIFSGKRPFVVGDSFTAEIQLCKDTSPPSGTKSAVRAPASIPAPTFNPPEIYDGQQLVTLETLVNGSHTKVVEVGTGPLGTLTTPVSWFPNFDVATPLGRPLHAGDQLQASQQLCIQGPPTETSPALKCDALPAPKISHPIVGDKYVLVTESVPGARIRVYDGGGIELGDGSGTVIVLKRAVTGADTITVVQQLGECTGKTGYRISARNSGSKG
jgi:hypothetical protein